MNNAHEKQQPADEAFAIERPAGITSQQYERYLEEEVLGLRKRLVIAQAKLNTSPLYRENQQLRDATRIAAEQHVKQEQALRKRLQAAEDDVAELHSSIANLTEMLRAKRSVRFATMFVAAVVRSADILSRPRVGF